MKKQLLASLVFATLGGLAQAQTSVTVYGAIDDGIAKVTDKTLAVTKRDSNKLGFKGSEDLGDGLQAVFQVEMRFEPDTGTVESNVRPLFQGQTRVGLEGAFGSVKIGRGVTAFQDAKDAFDPFHGIGGPQGFKGDVEVAGYTSEPLDPAGYSNDRFSNAIWYTSPAMNGFQLSTTIGTKEANGGPALVGTGTTAAPEYAANASASVTPVSIAATFKQGAFAAMGAYERNGVETKVWHMGGSVMAAPGLKLMATYARQDQGHTKATNPRTTGWLVGADYTMGASRFMAGYGQKKPDGVTATKQTSIGYEYSLSKRTFLYADASQRKAATSVNYIGLGVHHNF